MPVKVWLTVFATEIPLFSIFSKHDPWEMRGCFYTYASGHNLYLQLPFQGWLQSNKHLLKSPTFQETDRHNVPVKTPY